MISKLHILTAVSTVGGFLFGYDTGVISGALVYIQSEFHLNSVQSEIVVSATVLGAIVGAAIGSCGNEIWGRRKVILVSAALFMIGALSMGISSTYGQLVLGRLVIGLGLGLSSMTGKQSNEINMILNI